MSASVIEIERGRAELERARELLRKQAAEELILDPADPYPGAAEFLRRQYTRDGVRTLHSQAGLFYGYTGTHYAEQEEQAVRAKVWAFAAGAKRLEKPGEYSSLVPFQPTTTRVNNLLDATRAQAHLPAEHKPPCWLGGGEVAPADELVALANGLLDVRERRLYPHTPHFFTTNALAFAYDPDKVEEPRRWLEFLRQVWGEDRESVAALQEMFGYMLLPDTRQQKAFLLVGPKRSGKGTIARVLGALLGQSNVCAPTLAGLAMNFGLQPLIGKLLAIISDARLGGRADQAAIAERLLAISGEDAVTVERKHLPSWTGKLPTRFLILTNELPRLADSSGALAARFVVLTMERSFYGEEDPNLTGDLLRELPGIFAWALDGWERLQERGRFVQPETSADAIRELEDLGSPVNAFVRERCEVAPGRGVAAKALFAAWQMWCQEEGREHAGTAATFGRDLRAAVPGLKMTQPRVGGEQVRFYEGIGLNVIGR